jgi:hypothetical protein
LVTFIKKVYWKTFSIFSVCRDNVEIVDNKTGCAVWNWTASDDGACYSNDSKVRGMWNETLAYENKIKRILPSQEFFE